VKAYLAGPMSGHPHMNIPAFHREAARLRALGWDIVSPVELDHGDGGRCDRAPQHYLRNDIRALLDCEALIIMPGWSASVGARCELAIAITLGLPIYELPNLIQPYMRVLIDEGYVSEASRAVATP